MDFPSAIPSWLAGGAAAALVLSFFIYGELFRKLWRQGGKVPTSEFGVPDLFMGSLFLAWFAAVISKGFSSEERPVTTSELIQGSLMFLGIVVFVAGFLRWRHIGLRAQFGLGRLPFWKVPLVAAGLLAALLPVVMASGFVVQLIQGGPPKRQTIVDFFVESAKSADNSAILTTMFMGAVLAPMAEEFLFRGYLYGVLKRYCGWLSALVLNSLLFAAIHLNLASLLPLFILAMALTVAYEITGSILVNMTMHAMFNLTMFYALWQSAKGMP